MTRVRVQEREKVRTERDDDGNDDGIVRNLESDIHAEESDVTNRTDEDDENRGRQGGKVSRSNCRKTNRRLSGLGHGRNEIERAERAMTENQLHTAVTGDDEGDVTVAGVNKLNCLKRAYEETKGLCRRLSGTVKLYEEKCARLLEEKRALQLKFEVAESTIASSVSGSSRGKVTQGRNKSSSATLAMKMENNAKRFPSQVIDYVAQYMNKMTPSVHQYISEVTDGSCYDMHGDLSWSPNMRMCDSEDDYASEGITVHDWRGRCFEVNTSVTKFKHGTKRHPLGPPLWDYDCEEDGTLYVHGIYVPKCPMELAMNGELYTSDRRTVSNYVGQAAIAYLRHNMDSTPSKELEKCVYKCASSSLEVIKRFEVVCGQTVGTRKQRVKDVFLGCLGYRDITSARNHDDPCDTSRRSKQQKEVYNKLYKLNGDGNRDTSFWRKSNYDDICEESCRGRMVRNLAEGSVEVLFKNEAAIKALHAYQKFNTADGDRTSIMSLIRLDSIMTSAVDSFNIPEESEQEQENVEDNVGPSPRAGRRGGTIPTHVRRVLMELMPLAATQIIKECVHSFKIGLRSRPDLLDLEMNVGTKGSVLNRLRNNERKFTRCFQNPSNGHYYISLSPKAFRSFVSKELGHVADCYIMETTDLAKHMEVIVEEKLLDVNNESDAEDYDARSRHTNKKHRYQGSDVEDDDADDIAEDAEE